jgi:hypothetical protein
MPSRRGRHPQAPPSSCNGIGISPSPTIFPTINQEANRSQNRTHHRGEAGNNMQGVRRPTRAPPGQPNIAARPSTTIPVLVCSSTGEAKPAACRGHQRPAPGNSHSRTARTEPVDPDRAQIWPGDPDRARMHTGAAGRPVPCRTTAPAPLQRAGVAVPG